MKLATTSGTSAGNLADKNSRAESPSEAATIPSANYGVSTTDCNSLNSQNSQVERSDARADAENVFFTQRMPQANQKAPLK